MDVMEAVADKLDGRHRRTNIARLVGASAGVLGTASAAIGGVGLALAPVTAGTSAVVAGVVGGVTLAAGGVMAGIGILTTTGTEVVENVLVTADLAEVQRIVDRDREQCAKVQTLWNQFDLQCEKIVETLKFVDLSEEPDLETLKTWVLGAVRVTKTAVGVVAEAFDAAYKEFLTSPNKENVSLNELTEEKEVADPSFELLATSLVIKSMEIVRDLLSPGSVISMIASNLAVVTGVIGFTLIAVIGLGNLLVLIMTSINVHNGSLSKVAKDVREKASLLREEYDRWREALDNSV